MKEVLFSQCVVFLHSTAQRSTFYFLFHFLPSGISSYTGDCLRACDHQGVVHCKRKQTYLALVRVEVLCFLPLVIGDAFQCSAIVPCFAVVVAQDAENSISFQCTMTTNNQPPLSFFIVLQL